MQARGKSRRGKIAASFAQSRDSSLDLSHVTASRMLEHSSRLDERTPWLLTLESYEDASNRQGPSATNNKAMSTRAGTSMAVL